MASHFGSHVSHTAELGVLHSIYVCGGSGEGAGDALYLPKSKWSHFHGFHELPLFIPPQFDNPFSVNGSLKREPLPTQNIFNFVYFVWTILLDAPPLTPTPCAKH